MGRVFVEVPNTTIVAVRQPKSGHPMLAASVPAPSGDQTSYKGGWANVKLEPLVVCKWTQAIDNST